MENDSKKLVDPNESRILQTGMSDIMDDTIYSMAMTKEDRIAKANEVTDRLYYRTNSKEKLRQRDELAQKYQDKEATHQPNSQKRMQSRNA